MEPMTAQERNELSWAKNAKMVRLGVYDVGILLGAILLASKADMIAKAVSEFGSGVSTEGTALLGALALWVFTLFARYRDWHSVDRLEKGLDRDELEREMGRNLEKDELKNLGLD